MKTIAFGPRVDCAPRACDPAQPDPGLERRSSIKPHKPNPKSNPFEQITSGHDEHVGHPLLAAKNKNGIIPTYSHVHPDPNLIGNVG
jgi:hypothetical protein